MGSQRRVKNIKHSVCFKVSFRNDTAPVEVLIDRNRRPSGGLGCEYTVCPPCLGELIAGRYRENLSPAPTASITAVLIEETGSSFPGESDGRVPHTRASLCPPPYWRT